MADTTRHGKDWLYIDAIGRSWIISKHKLPKRRGEYAWWDATCGNLTMGRENTKTELVDKLKAKHGIHANAKDLLKTMKKLSKFLVN